MSPKKLWSWPYQLMEPSSLFSAQICQAQSTFSTGFLFLTYNNESTFHQQLHNVAKIPLNYVEKCPNIAQMQPPELAYERLDFIDHFLRSHLFWTARTLSITCANTAITKFSEPLMNHAMRWSRLLIIFQLAVKNFLSNVLTWNFVYALILDGILLYIFTITAPSFEKSRTYWTALV